MMKEDNEIILKVTKEIVVKFIEMGQLSVGSFDDVFKKIQTTVSHSLKGTPTTGKNSD
jgi:hypothetical protein